MKKTFKLEGLCCANCAAKIERGINELDGVSNATINFMTTKLIIEAEDEKVDSIISQAEKIIKKIEPDIVVKKLNFKRKDPKSIQLKVYLGIHKLIVI